MNCSSQLLLMIIISIKMIQLILIIMCKLLGTYQEEWEKQTINHDLYLFQLPMLLEHQVWMISIVANFSEKLHHSPVLFFFLLLSPRPQFASDHLLQSYFSLQLHLASIFWEWLGAVSRGFLFSHFRILTSAFLSSVLKSLKLCLL